MLHNAQVDLKKVLANIEQAIHSKLLILGQSSGHAELHATAFASLLRIRDELTEAIAKAEQTPVKSTKTKTETQ